MHEYTVDVKAKFKEVHLSLFPVLVGQSFEMKYDEFNSNSAQNLGRSDCSHFKVIKGVLPLATNFNPYQAGGHCA